MNILRTTPLKPIIQRITATSSLTHSFFTHHKLLIQNIRIKYLLLALSLTIFSSCSLNRQPVPLGQIPKAPKVLPEDESQGQQALSMLREKYQLTYDHPKYSMMQRVVKRIAAAAGASDSPWHVYLFDDDSVINAAATRGNHLFFWTGMLNLVESEDELATVTGHEIAHVIASHTNPKSSRKVAEILVGIASTAAELAVGYATQGTQASGIASGLSGSLTGTLGRGVFINPYDRKLETEADEIGLFLMARAQYNPQRALDFWRKFQTASNSSGEGLSFFSTHPSSKDRTMHLAEIMAHAEKTYAESKNLASSDKTIYAKEVTSEDNLKNANQKISDKNNFATNITTSLKQAKTFENSVVKKAPLKEIATRLWIVKSPSLKLRDRPSPNSKPLQELAFEERIFTETKAEGEWLRVVFPSEGYVEKSAVREPGVLDPVW